MTNCWFQLRSWSHGLWVWVPRQDLVWHCRGSLGFSLSLSLSLSLSVPPWLPLSLSQNKLNQSINQWHCSFPLVLLGHMKPSFVLGGHASRPVERHTWRGTEASCQQQAPTYELCEGTTLEVDPLTPVKPSDDCTLMRSQARTFWQNCSWIHDPQKLWMLVNLYYCVKSPSFQVRYYVYIELILLFYLKKHIGTHAYTCIENMLKGTQKE